MAGGTSSGIVDEAADSTETKKRFRLPRIPRPLLIVLVVVIVLGGAGAGVKFFVLKPQPDETTIASTAASPSGTVSTSEEDESPATPAVQPDDSMSGTVVRAGMRKCSVNRSHVFMVVLPPDEKGLRLEKELRLAGVDSFHYGPITQRADDAANSLMAGKSITIVPTEEDFFKIEGTATLADGRDMAETLAAAGLVQQADGATEAVKQACDEAKAAGRGIYALL